MLPFICVSGWFVRLANNKCTPNILNVLKTFSNIVVSIGCTSLGVQLLFSVRTLNTWNHKHALLISRYPDRQERNTVINRRDLKTKLYVFNTIGDVALTNISRETRFLCSIQNESSSPFLSLEYVFLAGS